MATRVICPALPEWFLLAICVLWILTLLVALVLTSDFYKRQSISRGEEERRRADSRGRPGVN